jgi:hypothetical protein
MNPTTRGFLGNEAEGKLLRFSFTASTAAEFARPLEAIDTEVWRQCREFGENGGEVANLLLVFF